MNEEIKEIISSYIQVLKDNIADEKTYNHVMSRVLEIYTKHLSYTDTINKLIEEVQGIKQNKELFNSLFNLAEALVGYNSEIKSNYENSSDSSSNEEFEDSLLGEIYDFTVTNV
jgi:hypothetical protein